MNDNRRSPYLVLGLPFGASKGDAARAFARATRRLRRAAGAPYSIEDVNWALHEVEQRAEDPGHSIDDYRMPADPGVYVVPTGFGVMDPEVKRLERRNQASSAADLDIVKASVVRAVASLLAKEIEGAPLPALHRYKEEGP